MYTLLKNAKETKRIALNIKTGLLYTIFWEVSKMSMRLSKLFGMDIYTGDAQYKGKVFDLVINLEKGRLETITTAPLKPRTKQEAKKIISEKSIPYKNVKSVKDIVIVGGAKASTPEPEERKHTFYKYSRR